MKAYIEPEMKIVDFVQADVIAASCVQPMPELEQDAQDWTPVILDEEGNIVVQGNKGENILTFGSSHSHYRSGDGYVSAYVCL